MQDRQRRRTINRRQFVAVAWVATVAGMLGQAGLALFRFMKPNIPAGGFGGEVVAGSLVEFEPGTVSYVLRARSYISRLEDGGILALWQRCTHLGCTVPWRPLEDQFNCPCHSSLFDRVGNVTGGPAPRPMDLFSVTIVDGKLIVNRGEIIERSD
ncbi:MAG: ubiquinol-cytochrome c reductase iron-sulfur subunit, partial [Anaerolineales bacterium]